jgi:hypothetical protein
MCWLIAPAPVSAQRRKGMVADSDSDDEGEVETPAPPKDKTTRTPLLSATWLTDVLCLPGTNVTSSQRRKAAVVVASDPDEDDDEEHEVLSGAEDPDSSRGRTRRMEDSNQDLEGMDARTLKDTFRGEVCLRLTDFSLHLHSHLLGCLSCQAHCKGCQKDSCPPS